MYWNRHSIRLKGYDYSSSGYYFITICTYKKEQLFGIIENNNMLLNSFGRIADRCWIELKNHFELELDIYQIMPNHIHGIIVLKNDFRRENKECGKKYDIRPGSIPVIVRSFKSATTNEIHKLRINGNKKVFHRNYYEHIIKNEKEYWAIKKYILDNPKHWEKDVENM